MSNKWENFSRDEGWIHPSSFILLLGREVVGYVIVKALMGGGEVNRVERVRAARKGREGLPFQGMGQTCSDLTVF